MTRAAAERDAELTALRAKLAEAERIIIEERARGDAAQKRIENIIEVAGWLQPSDIRNAAFWIVAPPRIEVPRPEDWEIDARIAQRTDEVDRVEKIVGLCLEKHFGELKQRAEAAEARVRDYEKEMMRVKSEAVCCIAEKSQLQAKLAAAREAIDTEWKKAEQERLKETDEHHAEAARWKSEDDMYGWNFHEGLASGTIGASFIYHRAMKAIAETVKE